ncbi:MAG: saccharopine dehydrogenase C-terminal domain-containing protein, partial [Gemmatimonadota bacterium]
RTPHDVVLADIDVGSPADFLEPHLGGRLQLLALDAGDKAAVRAAMEGASAVMSAFPYYFNDSLAEVAVDAGAHFCDLGGNMEIVLAQKALAARARAAGVSIVPDCGLAPGMVNILAAQGIRRLDEATEVYIKVGGLPQNPEPPLNYQVVYSLEGVIDYYTTLSWIIRDQEPVQVEALSEVEAVEFAGIGELEAFHTAGGLSLMAQTYAGRLDRMEYKTLRYPGHAKAVWTLRELGLFSTDPIDVKGAQVAPRDAFIATVGPKLRRDPAESPDLVALRVEVSGRRAGRNATLQWDLTDRYDPSTGITAMMRATGFSLAITGLMQAEGRIQPGAWTPDEVVPADEYVEALGKRGVRIRASER